MLLEIINDWLYSRGFVCYIIVVSTSEDESLINIQGYMKHANISVRDARLILTEYDMTSGTSARLSSVHFDLNDPNSIEQVIARLESFNAEKTQNVF
jgi:hypothetical protein